MTNNNRYKVELIRSVLLQITKPDDSYQTYSLFENQLVSILYIDPITGTPAVVKGRVCHFIDAPITRTPSFSYAKKDERLPIESVVIDTSQNYVKSNVTIKLTTILEVHPIDWEFLDTNQVVVKAPSEDWREENKEVSAPSSEYQYRFGEDGKEV